MHYFAAPRGLNRPEAKFRNPKSWRGFEGHGCVADTLRDIPALHAPPYRRTSLEQHRNDAFFWKGGGVRDWPIFSPIFKRHTKGRKINKR